MKHAEKRRFKGFTQKKYLRKSASFIKEGLTLKTEDGKPILEIMITEDSGILSLSKNSPRQTKTTICGYEKWWPIHHNSEISRIQLVFRQALLSIFLFRGAAPH
jgi:hypothetical protein